jgi:hypothetical protein
MTPRQRRMLFADPPLPTFAARFGFAHVASGSGGNWRGERDDDERVSAAVEHELEPADVAAIDRLRERSSLLVLGVDATGRTGPGHDGSRPTEPPRAMAILERAAGAACEEVPAFDPRHVAQRRRPVDERFVALGAKQLRGSRLRGRREYGRSWLPHGGSTSIRLRLSFGRYGFERFTNFLCKRGFRAVVTPSGYRRVAGIRRFDGASARSARRTAVLSCWM